MKSNTIHLSLVALSAVSGCTALEPSALADQPAETSSALQGTPLESVPATPLPGGYGDYCSGSWAGGVWHVYGFTTDDSCARLEADFGPGGTIQRAGYWSINGNNNAMVRCDGGIFYIFRGHGFDPVQWAYNAVTTPTRLTNCVFTVSPVALPIFGWPYDPSATVTSTTVFTYDHYLQKWDPTQWGQPADSWQLAHCPDASQDWCSACAVDRTGTEKARCQSCNPANRLFPCDQQPPEPSLTSVSPNFGNEPAYDWSVPHSTTKLLAVADGIVRGSQCRDVFGNGSNCLEELFIESQVGQGLYAEHFVAAYHHMDPTGHVFFDTAHNQWLPMPPIGTIVHRGDVVGIMGESGTSATDGSNIHLDFQVVRLTNLTGARQYVFQPNIAVQSYGFNGWQGIIDPFGWAAPQGVDPGAWKFLGFTDPQSPPEITDLGAFSINLWQPGVTPPTNGPIVN